MTPELRRSSGAGWRAFTADVEIALRPQHYVQAAAHAAIFLYWGWYWRPVHEAAPFIAAQLAFAYAVDILLARLRRRRYTLGFGPVPIVLSTNLFLWFKPRWFYWQFVLIAGAFAGKAFLCRTRDGRRAHIFNPSALALTIAALALLATGSSDMTWGREIAVTQFYPPHMYLFLFLVALPGQLLFGVTPMTLAAVVTTYLLGLAYYAATGTYFFIDSYIPIAVFLGMHFLFTDPSTSPRTELGRILFGVAYGASVVLVYGVLSRAGLPTFYDKLLPVPVLNLAVDAFDRLALRRIGPDAARSPAIRRRLAYAAAWGVVFGVLSAVGGVGDRHPGQWLPFWTEACRAGRPAACAYLPQLQTTLCRAGSGWACNELGIFRAERDGRAIAALAAWQRGCELGFAAACTNAAGGRGGPGPFLSAPPALADYPILLRGSKAAVSDTRPFALYARACELGWSSACGSDAHDVP